MESTRCRRAAAFWLPVFLYAGFLFYLSSLHHPSIPLFPYSDKIFHALVYSGYGFLFVRALQPTERRWKAATIVFAACLGTVLYGLTDEFHQSFVKGRSPDFMDVAADAAGGVLGGFFFLLCHYVEKHLRKRKVSGNRQALASL